MKKVLLSLLLIMAVMLVGCAKSKTIDGVTYEPYGVFNKDEVKADSISYRVCAPNIVWSVLLSESIIIPGWLIGWQLYEPVSKK